MIFPTWTGLRSRENGAQATSIARTCDVLKPLLAYTDAIDSAEIASGAPGPTNVDTLHREILDGMLRESMWETIDVQLSKSARDEMVLMWHKLDGACTI
jgi:hypothetical protein